MLNSTYGIQIVAVTMKVSDYAVVIYLCLIQKENWSILVKKHHFNAKVISREGAIHHKFIKYILTI